MPKLYLALAVATSALGAAMVGAQGGDASLPRSLAATCANCHGPDGVSVGEVASLAGRPKDEIAGRMREFKAGTRPGTIMPQLAKGYTDEQIDLVALWFAGQKAK